MDLPQNEGCREISEEKKRWRQKGGEREGRREEGERGKERGGEGRDEQEHKNEKRKKRDIAYRSSLLYNRDTRSTHTHTTQRERKRESTVKEGQKAEKEGATEREEEEINEERAKGKPTTQATIFLFVASLSSRLSHLLRLLPASPSPRPLSPCISHPPSHHLSYLLAFIVISGL